MSQSASYIAVCREGYRLLKITLTSYFNKHAKHPKSKYCGHVPWLESPESYQQVCILMIFQKTTADDFLVVRMKTFFFAYWLWQKVWNFGVTIYLYKPGDFQKYCCRFLGKEWWGFIFEVKPSISDTFVYNLCIERNFPIGKSWRKSHIAGNF